MSVKQVEYDRLRLKNVRCFRDAEIRFDKRVTVIVGGNASGKTTLLEAIASVAHGSDEGLGEFPLRHGTKVGEMALYRARAAKAVAKWESKDPSRTRLPDDSPVFLYGRYRRVMLDAGARNLSDSEYLDELASHATKSATTTLTRPDNRLLQDLTGYLRGLYSGRSNPERDALWRSLNAVLPQLDPSLSEIRMDPGAEHLIPKIVLRGVPLEVCQLSDGYQALLVIVLDLMMRYAYLFPGENPFAGTALVGIDEIDLHLHPRWQRTVLKQLTDLFSGTQFIITTHSPIVIQAAIDEGFAVLRLLEEDGGVSVKPLSARVAKALRGAEIGSLLFEDHLFGAPSRFSVEFEEVEKRVDELQAKVASGDATEDEYSRLKSGLDKLEELVAKEDRRRGDGSTMAQMVQMQGSFVKALMDELKKARP